MWIYYYALDSCKFNRFFLFSFFLFMAILIGQMKKLGFILVCDGRMKQKERRTKFPPLEWAVWHKSRGIFFCKWQLVLHQIPLVMWDDIVASSLCNKRLGLKLIQGEDSFGVHVLRWDEKLCFMFCWAKFECWVSSLWHISLLVIFTVFFFRT